MLVPESSVPRSRRLRRPQGAPSNTALAGRSLNVRRSVAKLATAPGALPDIERQCGRGEIDDPDVAVEIERALHLRKVSRRHERLLVHEERGHDRHADEI